MSLDTLYYRCDTIMTCGIIRHRRCPHHHPHSFRRHHHAFYLTYQTAGWFAPFVLS